MCCDFVEENWEVLRPEMTISRGALLKQLGYYKDGSAPKRYWGDEYTLLVAAHALSIRIIVLHKIMGAKIYFEDQGSLSLKDAECIIIHNGTNHYDSTCKVEPSRSSSGSDEESEDARDEMLDGDDTILDPQDTCEAQLLEAMQARPIAMSLNKSPSRQAGIESSMQKLAEKYLRNRPTVPEAKPGILDPDSGALWPTKHCAFQGCCWTGCTSDELCAHLSCQHDEAFRDSECISSMGVDMIEERHPHSKVNCAECNGYSAPILRNWLPFYSGAVALLERKKMPTVGCSVDRRSCSAYAERLQDKNLCAPICFMCARVLPYDKCDESSEIEWHKAFIGTRFGSMDAEVTRSTIGLDTYIHEYGTIPERWSGNPDQRVASKEIDTCAFDAWRATIPFESGDVDVLCCPEDVRCTEHLNDLEPENKLCHNCEVPMCNSCWSAIQNQKPHRPPLSLSNDLWFGYIPTIIYEEKVTYMELLCASICHPTMMSFQVNCYGWNLKKERVHMQNHRIGARGNMTAFQVQS